MDPQKLGELIGKMELVLDKLDDIEERLRALEKLRWKAAGMGVAVGTLAGVLTKLLG